ncbi:DNA repair protein Nse1 [Aspergillus luchuensis IFO 4308]|nr:DNA repair protein Nse1 [Aspergillus luchuensis IFO 4308]
MPRYAEDHERYDDSNRAFLQAFMARSTMTFPEAKPVLAAIFSVRGILHTIYLTPEYQRRSTSITLTSNPLHLDDEQVSPEDITEDDLQTYIAAANSAISPFDLEIRSILPQIEINNNDPDAPPPPAPERVYALVNTTSDALTQLATTYSADEIAFVKRILDAMFDTYNTRRQEAMVISSMQALQLAKAGAGDANRRESGTQQQQATQGGAAQSLTMTQAETMLKQLVEQGWFEKSRKGYYRLSPRGLMELRGWLVAAYNDEGIRKIKFCAACRDIITAGQRCGDRDCTGRLHDHCMRNFFRMQKSESCPVCKSAWPGDRFVGERAITMSDPAAQRARRSAANTQQVEAGPSTQFTLPELDVEDEADGGEEEAGGD